MIFFRIFIVLVTILMVFYYTLVIMQLFGILQFTTKKFTWKVIVPFYYFINHK